MLDAGRRDPSPAHLEVQRLGRPHQGRGDERSGTPAAAPPTRAASIVAGGDRSTASPTMAGWMRWFSTCWYTR